MADEADSEDVRTLSVEENNAVDEFCAFTGSTKEAAKRALEACDWNLEMAVTMQMDEDQPLASSSTSNPSASAVSRSDDEVRAPIPPVRQVLVDTFSDPMDVPMSHRTRSHVPFAPFRDFRGEAQYREDLASGESDADLGPDTAKRRTLEELFRPPIDIMFPGPFDGAKERGLRENRWLMVDVQDETDFRCQCLNRDVWSSPAVKSIIGECFVFWQVNKDHREGQRFMQFYPVKQFPYVAILDPQTGEQVVQWNTIKDPNMFCELVTDFLETRPTPSGELPDHHASAVAPVVTVPPDPEKVVGMSEEEQLKAAIAASLSEPGKSVVNVEDVDEINCDDDSPVEIGNHIDKSPVGAEVTSSGIDPVDGEEKSVEPADYRLYLGQSPESANLVLRFPDGQREGLTVPSDSKLRAISLLVQSKGFSPNQYDLVTNFPRRNIQDMSPDATLSSLGLVKEQLYIQLKQES